MADVFHKHEEDSEGHVAPLSELVYNSLLGAGKPAVDKVFGAHQDSLSAEKWLSKLELIGGTDKQVNEEELKFLMGAGPQTERIFRSADEDADGAVSVKEGVSLFNKMDSDHDHQLTRSEFNSFTDRI
ncbi:MAG: hypothetical protein EKK48_16310 [Candidatus Melainabacteria bacterium]|nr:MAG: hypothetical protein EKK48_16310 [Candidatus Melainabacteria bacterium]